MQFKSHNKGRITNQKTQIVLFFQIFLILEIGKNDCDGVFCGEGSFVCDDDVDD
jgi:hypothetical protein